MPAPASLLFVESKRESGIGNPQNTDLAQLLQVAVRPTTGVLALRPRVATSLPIRGADGVTIWLGSIKMLTNQTKDHQLYRNSIVCFLFR
jgi:hypothetical protein